MSLESRLGPEQLFEVQVVRQNFRSTSTGVTRQIEFAGRQTSSPHTVEVRSDDLQADWWKSYLLRGITENADGAVITAVDMFSGAGGLSLGLKSAANALGSRVEVLAAMDVDETALLVHQINHGTKRLITRSIDLTVDYKILGKHNLARFQYAPEVVDSELEPLVGNVDVVIAGPPCQGHSSLNNKTRHADDRNRLYLTVPAMAVALGARAVIIENVPGVVRDESSVVETTEHLLRMHGYRVTSGVVKAHKLGWPQTRQRFFMVALKERDPIPLLEQAREFARQSLSLRWAIHELLGRNDHALLDGLPTYTEENLARMSFLVEEGIRNLPNNIRPKSHQAGTTYSSVYGRLDWDEPAPTITTGFSTPGRGRFTHPSEVRTLTIREAARIQGFPDSYLSPDVLAAVGATRASASKWIGDAVPMPLGEVAAFSALAPMLTGR